MQRKIYDHTFFFFWITFLYWFSVFIFFSPYMSLSLCLFICLSICISVHLPLCLSIYLSICLPGPVSLCLSLAISTLFLSFPSSFIDLYIFPVFFPPLFLFWFSLSMCLSLSSFQSWVTKFINETKTNILQAAHEIKFLQLNIHCRATFTRFEWGVSKNYLHGGRDSQNLLKKNPMLYLAVLRGHSNNTWHSWVGDRHSATCTFYYNCI